ncbi:NlpC/P60 family protein [Kitasatospora phosalacinea]|uniref:C40 family peptidase n=1 Tax=Kitasatospora phosalacinea TaxID=2065 RepID=UPI0012FEAE7D|nr:NlpC/P60 family protein [Kitasatospora phosalacinea]
MGAGQRTESTGLRPWVRAALRCGAVLAAAALTLPVLASAAYAVPDPGAPTVSAGADPLAEAKRTLGPLLEQLHGLYQEAEAATEKYNGTVAALAEKQAAVDDLDSRAERQQDAVDAGTDLASQLASAQYRNSQVSGYAELLMAENPYEAVVIAELLHSAGRSQKEFLDRLKADRDTLTALRTSAEQALAEAKTLAAEQEKAKNDVAGKLATVEQLVGSLTGAQRGELAELEKQQANEAQIAFLASGALGKGERTPSAMGRKAVAWALQQLGKDYVWGGAGPDVFDCSGLTSQAWLHAGLPIPRTSQEQWARLKHVALNQIRPGDLIVYFGGATHIGMYIGGGLIVQAPHTGDVVKISQIGAMPILGAVRPDGDDAADEAGGAWKVPDVKVGETKIEPAKPSTLPSPPAASPTPTAPNTPGTPTLPTAPTRPTVPTVPGGPASPVVPGTPSGSGSAPASPSGSGSASGSASASVGSSGTPSGSGSPGGSDSASPSGSRSAG